MRQLLKERRPVIEKAEFIFRLLFFVYVCLGFNNLTYGTKIISVVMWPTYLLGAALLCLRALDLKSYRKMPGLLPLAALCGVSALSIVVNRRYDPKGNLIYLIFWLFYFFLLYSAPDHQPTEKLKKQFAFFFHLFCAAAFVLTAISFWMLAVKYHKVLEVGGETVRRGFLGGRLFGAYQTPNAGAVIASVVIVGCIHWAFVYKKPLYTLWAVVNVVLQFAYIAAADSRSGRLTLGACLGVYCFLAYYTANVARKRQSAKKAWKTAVAAALSLLVAAGAVYLPKLTVKAYNAAAISIRESDWDAEGTDGTDGNAKNKDDVLLLGRKDNHTDGMSNPRISFWKSGVEIFLKRPVLGVTFRGYLPFAVEYLPETYLVTNDFMQMPTLDNDVVNLMVSNGAAGLLCFALFVFPTLFRIGKTLYLKRKRNLPVPAAVPLLTAICAGISLASMFGSGAFYMQCQYSFLFWLGLGLLTRYCAESNDSPPGDKNDAPFSPAEPTEKEEATDA